MYWPNVTLNELPIIVHLLIVHKSNTFTTMVQFLEHCFDIYSLICIFPNPSPLPQKSFTIKCNCKWNQRVIEVYSWQIPCNHLAHHSFYLIILLIIPMYLLLHSASDNFCFTFIINGKLSRQARWSTQLLSSRKYKMQFLI